MLAVTSYPQGFVADCRLSVVNQLEAFAALAAGAKKAELAAFAPGYFNAMVLALDSFFLHRMRGQEGKDGNPLNEVRMLCDSIKENAGVLKANSTIKYNPAKSVTGLAIGDRIALDAGTFDRLATAFFDEIEKRFP